MRIFAVGMLLAIIASGVTASQSTFAVTPLTPLTLRETEGVREADAVLTGAVLAHDEGAASVVLQAEECFKGNLGDTVAVSYPSYRLGTARPRGLNPILYPTWRDVPSPRVWAADARFLLLLSSTECEDALSYSVTGWFELCDGSVLGRFGSAIAIRTLEERFLAGVRAAIRNDPAILADVE